MECARCDEIVSVLLHARHHEQVTQTLQLVRYLCCAENGPIDGLACADKLIAIFGPGADESSTLKTSGNDEGGQEKGKRERQGMRSEHKQRHTQHTESRRDISIR